ncbi:LacI family DNA-binding transcriptional regulator [Nocardiopsis nanhaiensis]
MAITSHDVARLAGVSQATVSRALRGDTLVAAATKAKVLNAAEALGYVPSAAGRNLATRRTGRIGVVITDLANPFYPHLVSPLHEEMDQRGYRMVVFAEHSEGDIAAEQLLDGSIDGVVLITAKVDSVLPSDLTRRGLPFVFLNRESLLDLGDASVVDNAEGGRSAAELLVGLGHRQIAAVFGPENTSTGRDREAGFRRALSEAGVGLGSSSVRHGPFEFDTGYRGLLEILEGDTRPTALFCGNDVIAIGALNAAMRAGVSVPEDLSVVGFDDIPMASWEAFRLTTIGHNVAEMAATAARLVIERIEASPKPLAPRRLVVPTRVVNRDTHAGPRTAPNGDGSN